MKGNHRKIIRVTFKGKAAETSPSEAAEFSLGWREGFAYAFFNYQEGVGFDPIPKGIYPEEFRNGWMEGARCGIGKRLDILYPGAKQLSYNLLTRKYDAKY